MATLNEMKEVLKEHLEKNGTLNEVRSKMRSEIFNTLNNKKKSAGTPSNQNLIINELIREYLSFNNYNYSNSVFVPEAGQPPQPLEREFVSKQLNVVEDSESKQLPLLYSIIFGLKSLVPQNDPQTIFEGTGTHDNSYGKDIFDVEQPGAMNYRP